MSKYVPKSKFEEEVRHYCNEFGGIVNSHIHMDRSYTRRDEFYSSIGRSISELSRLPLKSKQKLTWALHRSHAFKEDSLKDRMRQAIEESIRFQTKKVWTTVDTTYNTKLDSLRVALDLRDEYEGQIELFIGCYNPSGFKSGKQHQDRFQIFEEAAKESDFLMGLAEKDRDKEKGHIGEHEHNWYLLNLANQLQIPAHFHVGQENKPTDDTLEILLEDLSTFQDRQLRTSPEDFPEVVAVHAISTFAKSKEVIKETAEKMKKRNVSLICCPRAAISMRQDPLVLSPTHNSIANIWELAHYGVRIKGLGVDNLDDIYIPSTSADTYDEVQVLADALRFYDPRIMAKVLCGNNLDEFDISTINENLNF